MLDSSLILNPQTTHKVTVLPPLPRRVRRRLRRDRRIDGVGYWLVCHRRFRTAELLWRLTGRW